ncbi:MAG TPA: hypothetical protein PK156_03710 [Polyangium sp.]|nr:hypothetical protein [Polyangium sp.]
MARLEPQKTQTSAPAAIEVKPNAAVVVKKSETKPGKVKELKWSDAGAEENRRRGEEAARANKEATDAEKAAYKKYYDSVTAGNGCSVPGSGIAQDGSYMAGWRSQPNVDACNAHDVAYGRGGSAEDKKAADLELYRRIKANGEPVRATITYYGVRVGGPLFFYYRKDGPLPIPEGK